MLELKPQIDAEAAAKTDHPASHAAPLNHRVALEDVAPQSPDGERLPTVTRPIVIREVKPAYTADAQRAKVQGSVWLEVTVLRDGTVGDVRVTRSLDPIFGLDQQAIAAAKQWRFRPAMRGGQPAEFKVTIELTFSLR